MPLLDRLGVRKSAGIPSLERHEGEEEALTEDESFIKSVLVQNEALEYAREVSVDDLIEMGISDPLERATAWKILRQASNKANEKVIKSAPLSSPLSSPTSDKGGKRGRKSKKEVTTGRNKGLLSQDGLAWGAEEHWKGWRQERLTCAFFPCCLCAWLCRKTFSDAESYSLTNVALFVSVRSGVFCPTVRLMTIYLHSITGLTIVEEDPITGTRKVGGVPLLKHHTKIHVHTNLGPRIAIRVRRHEAERIYDDIMIKASSARALRAETTPSESGAKGGNSNTAWGTRAGLGFMGSVKTSLLNSDHDLFWYRVSLFALASIIINGLGLTYVEADRDSYHYELAIVLYYWAIAFNALSLAPLYLITTILRTNRALLEAEAVGITGYARAQIYKYQHTTLMASRACYLLCDISADFLQFVAQLQLSLAVDSSINAGTIVLSIINLMGLALGVLEIHNEMIEWAGTRGRCVRFESRFSFIAVVGSFSCAIVIYSLFCATGSYEDRNYYGTLFIIVVAAVIFGSIFMGILFVSCEGLKNYCCGITVEYFDTRGGGSSGHNGSTKSNERESALGQLIDMITKLR